MTQEDHQEGHTIPSKSADSATGMPSLKQAEAGSFRLPEGWAAALVSFLLALLAKMSVVFVPFVILSHHTDEDRPQKSGCEERRRRSNA